MSETRIDPAGLRVVAEQLASDAADFVRRRRQEVFAAGAPVADAAVRSKSTRTDPVTIVDTETERLLRVWLSERRPGDPVLGEEGGGPQHPSTGSGSVTWVLDPIDGTVNFLYGIPAYAVSVAAQVDGVSVAGAVVDVPAAVVYSAALGAGAQVIGPEGHRETLRCNAVDELALALLGTGFGYAPQRRAAQGTVLNALLPHVRDVRRIGSAALDLCMVATGRLDGFYEHGLGRWDWAAGGLIAAEAGARLHLPNGDGSGALVAAAPGIADDLLDRLASLGVLDGLPEGDGR